MVFVGGQLPARALAADGFQHPAPARFQRAVDLCAAGLDAEFAALIADKTAAYIASKGDDLGITCTPRVEMEDRDGVPWPSAVTLDIPKDEALSAWLSTELAIDDAHQYWREADE